MITEDDIRRTVGPNAFQAGLRYQMDRRVGKLRVAANGATIDAEVRGTARSPYLQTILVSRATNGQPSLIGSCTCPVGFNCKHVAATLLEYRRSARARPALPTPQPSALPSEVEAWLARLDATGQDGTETYPPGVRTRLLYVLGLAAQTHAPTVELRAIELGRDGIPDGTSTPHDVDRLLRADPQPTFLRPSDRGILRRLAGLGTSAGEEFVATLRSMVGTGRARWAAWDGPVLAEAAPVGGELAWIVADDGQQRPDLVLPAPLIALRLATVWYVDPATGAIGPVETVQPARLVRAVLDSPALPPAIAARVRDEMARRLPGRSVPAPQPITPARTLREPLRPHLLLLAGDLPFDPTVAVSSAKARPALPAAPKRALARLSWRYGPISIPSGTPRQPDRIARHEGALVQVVRDAAAEDQALDRLRRLGLVRIDQLDMLPDAHPHADDLALVDPDPAALLELVLDDVPQLRADGWLVDIADDFPLRLVEADGDLSVEIEESSGIDWFDLDLGIMVEGERVSLVPALLDFIARSGTASLAGPDGEPDDGSPPLLLPLPDGRLLSVPLARLRPILAPLLELFAGAELGGTDGLLRLSRRNVGDLALLEAAGAGSGVVWTGGEAIRALGRQLREHGGIPPCPLPAGFQATLRGYQEQGLAWLQFLRTAGLGGVLADDMGLGKTVQALAHVAVEQDAGRLDRPALVICPTSLVPNWHAEADRFAPRLRLLVLHGPDRADRFTAIGRHDLVVTTYPLLARDHAVLSAQQWHVVILDEAQTIKNPLATTSKLARTLQARQRLCLSGTPLENHLGELWSLFDFLLPGLLGDRRQFGARYRGPIEKAGNSGRQALLAQRIAPFLLRRTKEQVAADLPPKTDIAETVEMAEGQRALYEGIRLAMHAKVRAAVAERGLAGSGIIILDALLKLRQACCDPRLLKLPAARSSRARSAKLERLLEMLPQMLEEGRRILLFSQFTSMLALIEAELARLELPYVLLTGDTRDRTVPVRRFQSGEVPLFLISLKAGGVGLNLTAADTVIHYDPWWNPAVEEQATDRAHRIGQDKPVFVHRLTTAGTIEEKMEVLKQRKQALASGILGGPGGSALGLTEGDLESLLGA